MIPERGGGTGVVSIPHRKFKNQSQANLFGKVIFVSIPHRKFKNGKGGLDNMVKFSSFHPS